MTSDMKKFAIGTGLILIMAFSFSHCKKDNPKAPTLPPKETMSTNFSVPVKTSKSGIKGDPTQVNYGVSALTAAYWNAVLGITLAVPVATFYKSFESTPKYLGDKKWQWEYSVIVVGGTYDGRLVGTVRQNDVKWEMFVSKTGVGAFAEFMWFEGTSNLDGNGGQWILYESPTVNEKVIQIDWTRTNDTIGNIKYTYVRESDNGVAAQLSLNSYINYGLQEGDYNAFYNIHFNTRDNEANPFYDVLIEWNTTQFYGHIKAGAYFSDSADPQWHCWDGNGNDVVCP
jgi:hypothetical protein